MGPSLSVDGEPTSTARAAAAGAGCFNDRDLRGVVGLGILATASMGPSMFVYGNVRYDLRGV
jgi:hypothetical protein